MNQEIELVSSQICLLGEGPIWDPMESNILWVDILNGEVHQYSILHKRLHTIKVGEMVGAVCLRKKGGLLAGLKNGLAFLDSQTGKKQILSSPEAHLPFNRFNDGKCDPAGRFWAGTMATAEVPLAGKVYVMNSDYTVSIKIKDVTISNGMAWSPDYKSFYYIDTLTRQVVKYEYDLSEGTIANKRSIVTIKPEAGFPDGMTVERKECYG